MIVADLWFEALFLGVVALWSLGLVPAATITVLKRQWALFGVGWLTLGLSWFIGAIAFAPPDSWWAQRFYGEKRMARAAEPLRHPRPLRSVALGLACALVATIVVGLVAARPAPLLGLGGMALQRSVGGSSLGVPLSPCTRLDSDSWRCSAYDNQFSGTVSYRVELRGFGCWTATREGWAGEGGSDKHFSDCVTIADYLLARTSI